MSILRPRRECKEEAMETPRNLRITEFRPPVFNWQANSYRFDQECAYPTESGELKPWGRHVGVDTNCPPSTPVCSIAAGVCVYSGLHAGKSKDERNWGNVIILRHTVLIHKREQRIYSLYGHLTDLRAYPGDFVVDFEIIGRVAMALTPENGWWEDAHLHFAVLADPKRKYRGGILPGYDDGKQRYALEDWVDPEAFFYDWRKTLEEVLK